MILKTVMLTALLCLSVGSANPQDTTNPPEEPDFFFMTGGPYTQQKYSPQVIWASQWLRSRTGGWDIRELSGAGRVEMGLTDYLEADFEFGTTRTRQESGTHSLVDSQFDGMMLGARYRVLREDFAPLTLTIGPQFLIPNRTARSWETGYGYGVDLTAAKDWGGPVFAAASINWRNTPGVRPTHEGPSSSLQELSYAFALGLRPLEAVTRSEAKHDLHVFTEVLATREEGFEANQVSTSSNVFFAPGVRYGFMNRRGILGEVGVAFPIGLNRDAPNWGTILQLQIEMPSVF
ncbi:MAG: hypothetical protein EHM23_11070 [Acidobacteria bacterium]|nr:MAG: hypothetical protein EHM23_11070 [Acidobacteriota bacterium]